jgi:hypothetical protein
MKAYSGSRRKILPILILAARWERVMVANCPLYSQKKTLVFTEEKTGWTPEINLLNMLNSNSRSSNL